ncbi:uncharacterized protein LY79DRAFT_410854 [Colletotrichum navitas]|uniref:Uncharacterized protein n=1 Tax=Colletotrichum navitas TaxID=681940 RepID=A0AAD8PPZ8_9PEZI|nr:uncharacterized protein LY79DRAFT_410854 [Colletotrichum navitas]KAK1573563.1 hypothetical protein LY79DRAFT_410854 [Colletotrichum navitas]
MIGATLISTWATVGRSSSQPYSHGHTFRFWGHQQRNHRDALSTNPLGYTSVRKSESCARATRRLWAKRNYDCLSVESFRVTFTGVRGKVPSCSGLGQYVRGSQAG